jgi:hypothetical protein
MQTTQRTNTKTLCNRNKMTSQRNDIVETIEIFTTKHDPFDRYASYDYCFNHFHPTNKNCITDDMEKSCLSLGFYLASWGMFRGSSFLLNKSAQAFVPLIEYISELDSNAWEIDANNLNDNVEQTIEIYNNVKSLLIPKTNSHLTLTTKIMLGVFGSVPAYDRFFINSFKEIFKGKCGFSSFNKTSLICIADFYNENKSTIELQSSSLKTIGFNNSAISHAYTRSKVIDMYGFTKGLNA